MAMPTVYQFKITLIGIWPPIWRRIVVPDDFTFYALHCAIQDAMGWKNQHSYRFSQFSCCSDLSYSIGAPVGVNLPLSQCDMFMSDYFIQLGDSAIYKYDFSSRWLHTVVLEQIWMRPHFIYYPQCVDGGRGCPPEGIGGAERYESHLRVMYNTRHPLHNICMAWLAIFGGNDTPEHFDRRSVVFTNAEEILRLSRSLKIISKPFETYFQQS